MLSRFYFVRVLLRFDTITSIDISVLCVRKSAISKSVLFVSQLYYMSHCVYFPVKGNQYDTTHMADGFFTLNPNQVCSAFNSSAYC